ncbi:HigA family addiction module antitoxin [Chryseobacterium sp. MEBOG07]|uniref:HigA family addiction module antitoxin n=1 Tax=Chryseobacterium sp. MEBOG07 TaxID=2879939 RepID=UPI001F010A96|nr:HigA family addiction module antitoxin [Chryseobacterium sp. MEBOG07]UKB79563.1 HigA family addiction module antidote protein [Chryseobacterium sp. MEBOG07]
MKSLTRGIKHNTHPGEILLNQIVKANNLTVDKAAKHLGITRPTLSNIVNGKSAITPIMAIRISKVFGGNPAFWIRLQSAFDLRKAEQEFEEDHIELDKF